MSLENLTPRSMSDVTSTAGTPSNTVSPNGVNQPQSKATTTNTSTTSTENSANIQAKDPITDIIDDFSSSRKKRSRYSRNGCKECKRRKLKCDETKPACWQCTRLGKSCLYLDKAQEKEMRDAAKKASLKAQLVQNQLAAAGNLQENGTPSHAYKTAPKKEFEVKFAKPITIDGKIPFNYEEEPQKIEEPKPIPDLFNFSAMDSEFKNFFNDETLLNDLNSLATEILDDISISPSSSIASNTLSDLTGATPFNLVPLDSEHATAELNYVMDHQPSVFNHWDEININEILSQFTALPMTHQADLREFLLKISSFLFPFNQNIMIKILTQHASHCKYLLYAMLSLSSRHASYKKQYLAVCFKSMKETFEKPDHENQTEPLILAILLLATDSTSKDWKFHLRGAKDILLKVVRNKKLVLSPGLMLAKSWFIAIEILARLESIGITTSEAELDELLNYDFQSQIQGINQLQIAVDIGLLLHNGYDLFLGYSKEFLDFYKCFFHLQALYQSNDHFEIGTMELLHIMKLAEQSLKFEVATNNVMIPESSPYHPSNPLDPPRQFRQSCFACNHQTGIYFSWFDLTHQMHVLSLMIRTYLQFLPYDAESHIVQDLVTKMINMCYFYTVSSSLPLQNPTDTDLERFITISNEEDARLLLLQGPMVQIGLCSADAVQRYKVKLYFNSLIKFGVPSALSSLQRLENVWTGRRGSGFNDLSHVNGSVPFA